MKRVVVALIPPLVLAGRASDIMKGYVGRTNSDVR